MTDLFLTLGTLALAAAKYRFPYISLSDVIRTVRDSMKLSPSLATRSVLPMPRVVLVVTPPRG